MAPAPETAKGIAAWRGDSSLFQAVQVPGSNTAVPERDMRDDAILIDCDLLPGPKSVTAFKCGP